MIDNIQKFVANPLNQILLGIPLSVVGSYATEYFNNFIDLFENETQTEKLEQLLFTSFIKALKIHQKKYDSTAKEITSQIMKKMKDNKNAFIDCFKYEEEQQCDFLLPTRFDEEEIKELFVQLFMRTIGANISEKDINLVHSIVRDTCSFYKDSFYETITQEQQTWLIFKESIKIQSIVELVRNIEKNIPTRDQFEVIRKHVLDQELIPQTTINIKSAYHNYIGRKYSSIELKGVSPRVHGQDIVFDIEDIFIPLKIIDINKTKFTTIYEDSINKYDKLIDNSDPLSKEKIDLLTNLEKYPKLVLLGEPGCGKSTLLKYIIHQIHKFSSNNEFLPYYIPIFLKISEYAQYLRQNPSTKLTDFLFYNYDYQFQNLYKWAFDNGQALLLLDGLDEVLDISQRIKVVDEVEDLILRMPENRYIITSRLIGYNDAKFSKNIVHFKILPFDRRRLQTFCKSWYRSVFEKSNDCQKFVSNESNKLYEAIIQKPEIENIACNPLLVTLIANIHFKGQTLPYHRVQLYDIATETLLQYWVQNRVYDQRQLKDKDDVVEILSPIAYYIHKSNPEGVIDEDDFEFQCKNILQSEEFNLSNVQAKNEIKELKRFLEQQSGFFHEKGFEEITGKKLFGFMHQTFQEYLAAIEIVNRWKENKLDLSEHIANPRWVESIILACGVLKGQKGRSGKREVTNFIKAILEQGDNYNGLKFKGIFIVTLALIDNIDISPIEQDRFFELFFEYWGMTNDAKDVKEINDLIGSLLKSKHKETVSKRIITILEDEEHDLVFKLPEIIEQNSNLIRNAKDYYHKYLLSENREISDRYWEYLSRYISNASGFLYQDIEYNYHQYYYNDQYEGYAHFYLSYDPASLVNNLMDYSDFLAFIEKIPLELFLKRINEMKIMLTSYVYIYNSSNYDWYNYVKGIDYFYEIKAHTLSSRLQELCLSILNDLNLKSEKLHEGWKEVIQYVNVDNERIESLIDSISSKMENCQ